MTWAERAADRSPIVQRSRTRASSRPNDRSGRTTTDRSQGSELHDTGTHQGSGHRAPDVLPVLSRARTISSSPSLRTSSMRTASSPQEERSKLGDPVDRFHLYVTATLSGLEGAGTGPSFITSEHLRLQTTYPDEVSAATRPFTDLLLEEIRGGEGHRRARLARSRVLGLAHHPAGHGRLPPLRLRWSRRAKCADRGEGLEFCLAALGGDGSQKVRPAKSSPRRRAQ